MTIPTTNKAITETPANTPRPIGNTSSFFPGGSKAAPAFSGVAVGGGGEDDEPDESGKGDGEDVGKVTVDEPMPPGCGLAAGFGKEEITYRKGQIKLCVWGRC